MATRGKGARRKGANFERWLANSLSEMTGLKAQRGLAQTRGGGAEVSDVSIDYIHVEAKNHIRSNIKAALRQAINDCEESGKIPVAITKDDRKPVLCTMLLDDWIKFFNAYIAEQQGTTQKE